MFRDRRESPDSEDFNNPRGTFSLTQYGDGEQAEWAEMDASPENRKHVHEHFRAQKDTKTWREANRLAQRRAAHEARVHGAGSLNDYADSYLGHLISVMSTKGPGIADSYGEIGHRQGGYGRV